MFQYDDEGCIIDDEDLNGYEVWPVQAGEERRGVVVQEGFYAAPDRTAVPPMQACRDGQNRENIAEDGTFDIVELSIAGTGITPGWLPVSAAHYPERRAPISESQALILYEQEDDFAD